MKHDWRLVPALVLFIGLMFGTRDYLQHWHSNLTLWAYTVSVSPLKPRPMANFGTMLIMEGQFKSARIVLNRADQLTNQLTVPNWERGEVRFIVEHNLQQLDTLEQINDAH